MLESVVGGTETALKTVVVPGVTYTPGMVLNVRLQVTGTSPTTLSSMVWANGTTQPATWQATTTDSTSILQVAGAVGLLAYLSGSATNAPELPLTQSGPDIRALTEYQTFWETHSQVDPKEDSDGNVYH